MLDDVKPVAEAAAAWGRHTILTTIEMAKKAQLKVVYGDTDSIFLENQPEKIEKLSKQIKQSMGLESSQTNSIRVSFSPKPRNVMLASCRMGGWTLWA